MYFCCFNKQCVEFKRVVIGLLVKIDTLWGKMFRLRCVASYTSLTIVTIRKYLARWRRKSWSVKSKSFLRCHGLVTVQLPASSNLILKWGFLYLLNILFEHPFGIIKWQPTTGEVGKPCCSGVCRKARKFGESLEWQWLKQNSPLATL